MAMMIIMLQKNCILLSFISELSKTTIRTFYNSLEHFDYIKNIQELSIKHFRSIRIAYS